MQLSMQEYLNDWVHGHRNGAGGRLYFAINDDLPHGQLIDIPQQGELVAVMNWSLFIIVAEICHRHGVKLVQV